MYDMYRVLMMGLFTVLISIILTPLIRKFAFIIKAVDYPDKRRVNTNVMPTMGGLAVYLTFFISMYLLQPVEVEVINPIFISSSIVVFTGIIDDIKEISPKAKILGILVATLIIYYWADIRMNMITIPFLGQIEFGILSLPITLIWVMAITNSINLIDGLDGLASGVSIIALSTMSIISFFFLPGEGILIFIQIFTLVCAILGFLPYNFYPAKLYLGDTGALFLGYMISVFSLYGLKNVTIISLIVPVIILGIPITDTVYAMVRRYLNKKPISAADKHHMHHRLMSLGLSHKQTVLSIYAVALIFSFIALLYPLSSIAGSIFITIALIFGLELFVELIGLVGEDRRPLLNRLSKIFKKNKPRK